jgi:hypothetical protein
MNIRRIWHEDALRIAIAAIAYISYFLYGDLYISYIYV